MAGIPNDIILRALSTPPKKAGVSPIIGTAPGLRDGFRDGGVSNGEWVAGQAPVVEGVSGSFEVGQQLTIDVANLSTKRNGQLFYDNFEANAVGDPIQNWEQDLQTPDALYLVADDSPYFGQKYGKSTAVQQLPHRAMVILGQDYPELFFEAWQKIDPVTWGQPDGSDAPQLKQWRIFPDAGNPYNGDRDRVPSAVMSTSSDKTVTMNAAPDDPETSGPYYGQSLDADLDWNRVLIYWKMSNVNTRNGKRMVRYGATSAFTRSDGGRFHKRASSTEIADDSWISDDLITNDGLIADGGTMEALGVGVVYTPYFTREHQDTTISIDRVYINDSPERVVVGDASTWVACDHKKTFILPQISRESGQIIVDVDALGPLDEGAVYLYVFNQDELYNESGYLIRPNNSVWVGGESPVIEAVSGSFGAGLLTINGTNFSTKKTDGQVLYLDYSELNVGDSAALHPELQELAAVGGDDPYVVRDDDSLFGGKYISTTSALNSLPTVLHIFDEPLDEIYFEAWARFDLIVYGDPAGSMIKDFRLIGGLNTSQHDSPGVGCTLNPTDMTIYQFIGPDATTTTNDRIWYGDPQEMRTFEWSKRVHYLKLSDPGVANGERYSKTSLKQGFTASAEVGHYASPSNNISIEAWEGDKDLITRHDDAMHPGIGHFYMPFYTRDDQTTRCDVERIFVNNSPERVAVGTQPTWLGCNSEEGKRFVLPQISRASDEIVVNSDSLGPIEDTDAVYLYVVNRDGKYNENGILIREANPSIESVSGSFEAGQTVTISGKNFGTKPTAEAAIPLEDFSGASESQLLEDYDPTWIHYDGSGATLGAELTLTDGVEGGACARNTTLRNGFESNYKLMPASDTIFASGFFKIKGSILGDSYAVVKNMRVGSTPASGGGGAYNEAGIHALSNMAPFTRDAPSVILTAGDNTLLSTEAFGANRYFDLPYDEWVRIDFEIKLSTPGQADGLWAVDVPGVKHQEYVNLPNRDAGYNFQLDSLLLGLMHANHTGADFELLQDLVYGDTSFARVEIGDNSYFYACDYRRIIPATAWSDSSISLDIPHTVPSGTYYLFVKTGDRVLSQGFQVIVP